jgi:hypothetical protein
MPRILKLGTHYAEHLYEYTSVLKSSALYDLAQCWAVVTNVSGQTVDPTFKDKPVQMEFLIDPWRCNG